MAQLFSRWESGTQVTAGTMVGSVMGESGLNVYADRLNSITTDNNLVTGSMVSGTSTCFIGSNINALNVTATDVNASNVSGTNMNVYAANVSPGGVRNYAQKSIGEYNNPTNNVPIGSVYVGHNTGDIILIQCNGTIGCEDALGNSVAVHIHRGVYPSDVNLVSVDTSTVQGQQVSVSLSYIDVASSTGSTAYSLEVGGNGTDDWDGGDLQAIVFKI